MISNLDNRAVKFTALASFIDEMLYQNEGATDKGKYIGKDFAGEHKLRSYII